MIKILFNKLKITSSPFYLLIKVVSIPEALFWIITSSIFVSKKPPLRVWLSMRMLQFFTCGLSSKFSIRLTIYLNKLFKPLIKQVSSSTYLPQNSVSDFPLLLNESPFCDYVFDLSQSGSSFLGYLDHELLAKVIQIFESSQLYEDVPCQYTMKKNNYSSTKTGRFFIHPSNLYSFDLIRQISANRFFLELCHAYFGLPPILYSVNAWTSNYIDNKDPSLVHQINDWNARFPHIDYASLKFLKIFIFLDPVTESDGPFHYWPRSNNHNCCFTSDGRYNYAEIGSLFGNPIKFTSSKPGSIFVADTSNYHCDGIVLQGGSRRVLQFEYCLPGIRNPNPLNLLFFVKS